MFNSGVILDSHSILMFILLVVAVIYLIQNSNSKSDNSDSKQLVPVRKRKLKNKNSEQKESFTDKTKVGVKFIMYYVPWCPHCKTTKPEWNKLEKYVKENLPWATVESIDCEQNPNEAEKNNVQYFPTILITKDGEKESNEYEGPRKFNDMKQFLENY